MPLDLVSRLEGLVPDGDPVVAVSARLEEEGAKLSAEDRSELFEGLGLGEGALAVMVRAAYQGLGSPLVLHRRAEGIAGMDGAGRGGRPRSRREDSLRSRTRFHPGRGLDDR